MTVAVGRAFTDPADGDMRGDPKARRAVSDRLGISADWATLTQVHGGDALRVDRPGVAGEADALVTTRPGLPLAVFTADCLGVVLSGPGSVGVAHAGWRGLAGQGGVGVLESAMRALFERFQALALINKAQAAIKNVANNAESFETVARGTLAWLGPCIGPQAFEVGPEVREAFCAAGPQYSACFVPSPTQQGKWLADLAGLARLRLQAMGVTRIYGNDSSAAWCTVTQSARFFSHRRDTALLGGSGRLAACIWRG